MNPWLIPAALSIFGAIEGINAGDEMKDLARQQSLNAEENALLEKRELQEQVRRQEDEDSRLRASALARAAASGARLEGSPLTHIDYLKTEQTKNLDWMKSAGASRIRLNLQSAKLAADAMKKQGKTMQYQAFFGGLTSAFGFADKGGMFTTTTPTKKFSATQQ